jgi:hypothetical protein
MLPLDVRRKVSDDQQCNLQRATASLMRAPKLPDLSRSITGKPIASSLRAE